MRDTSETPKLLSKIGKLLKGIRLCCILQTWRLSADHGGEFFENIVLQAMLYARPTRGDDFLSNTIVANAVVSLKKNQRGSSRPKFHVISTQFLTHSPTHPKISSYVKSKNDQPLPLIDRTVSLQISPFSLPSQPQPHLSLFLCPSPSPQPLSSSLALVSTTPIPLL